MRNKNCGNIRREIESAGAARSFSGAVRSHIRDCAECATISRQQDDLHSIVSSLRTVEVPGDFDFRLRARLAEVDQKRTSWFSLSPVSLGFRTATVAAVLFIVAGVVFFNFKPTPIGLPVAVQPGTPSTVNGTKITPTVNAVRDIAQAPKTNDAVNRPLKPGYAVAQPKHRALNSEVAGSRSSNRSATRDLSSTTAGVLRPFGADGGGYPTQAFPINASYQSMKVSVDNGSGSPRTISLPSVSFGSQRALSQNATPLMASARGTW